MANKQNKSIKQGGQIFTPNFLVCEMLDLCQYSGNQILHKHIIDNSCGEGAFLIEIIKRYTTTFLEICQDKELLKNELSTYIHGIEINEETHKICIEKLDEFAAQYELYDIKWDIKLADALCVNEYNDKMDYVVGNPPYVRVHNLKENYDAVKLSLFTQNGMTDLYLAFFEIGFNMLSPNGVLCYITPSSWLNSLAGKQLRQYIREKKTLKSVINLEHFQPFEQATTYTIISLFSKDEVKQFSYFTFDPQKREKLFVEKLTIQDIYIGDNFYLSSKQTLSTLKQINEAIVPEQVIVKNGFATLADNVFIQDDFPFNQYVIPVIKASTGKWRKAFFPYNEFGKPIDKQILFDNKHICEYLQSNKSALLKGQDEKENHLWYLYGRTQALADVYKSKIAINTIIKDIKSLKINKVECGSGVYSGLYILTNIDFSLIENILLSQDFVDYIKALQKYKSGGYYTFNTADLQHYLNHKLYTI